MAEEKSAVSRRSFLEKVALGAGLVAAGGVVRETISPAPVEAATQDLATLQMNAGAFGWNLNNDVAPSEVPGAVVNPNILMIMVDQLRIPQYWLTNSPSGGQQALLDSITPNITWIRKHSYSFSNFYVAAQNCTPSRATLLTGLYAPQTGMFATQTTASAPDLDTRFPTFADALHDIAGYSLDNLLWFGKWHLSNQNNPSGPVPTDLLPQYGLNGGVNAGSVTWPSVNGSPNGTANEGNNGYTAPGETATTLASDAAIAASFVNFWNSPAKPTTPWFACVSFINPHDISDYPGFYPPHETMLSGSQGDPQNPNNPADTTDFLPSVNTYSTTILSTYPSPWNYESTLALEGKSVDVTGAISDSANFLQPFFQQTITDETCNYPNPSSTSPPILSASDYTAFLNWYFYMVQLVDTQIGNVLAAALPGYSPASLPARNPSSNTNVIFLSDHGEYGGSHGLHAKGGAVYDEVLRVPLYVSFPLQSGAVTLNQMCSMVDMFMFIVELALGTTYNWSADARYEDQYLNQNQSILTFIGNNNIDEMRYFTGSDGNKYSYILTTTDETIIDRKFYKGTTTIDCSLRNHVMCIRTKSEENHSLPSSAYTGGKLAIYSKWLLYPTSYNYPIIDATLGGTDLIAQDFEYYDYLNYQNRGEVGNDYATALSGADGHGISGSGPGAQSLLADMATALGSMAKKTTSTTTPASGLAATVLTRTLSGTYAGNALSTLTIAAIRKWYTQFLQPALSGTCSS